MDHRRDMPRAVRATGIAVSSARPGAKRIEAVMTAAAQAAAAEGITDPTEIRRRMLAARDAAKGVGRAAGA